MVNKKKPLPKISVPESKRRRKKVHSGVNFPAPHAAIKPGEARNPQGIRGPDKKTVLEYLKEILSSDSPRGRAFAYEVAQALVGKATKGSFPHIKEIMDRESGKTTQKIEVTDGTDIKLYEDLPPMDDPEDNADSK